MSWKSILAGLLGGLLVGTLSLIIYWRSAWSEFPGEVLLYTICCGLGPGAALGLLAGLGGNMAVRRTGSPRTGVMIGLAAGIVLGLISGLIGIALSIFASPK